jgi:hypothetical protein
MFSEIVLTARWAWSCGLGNHEMPHDGYTNFMKDMG